MLYYFVRNNKIEIIFFFIFYLLIIFINYLFSCCIIYMLTDFLLKEIFISYLLNNNDFTKIKTLTSLCNNNNLYIKNDIMYKRKKSASLLCKLFPDNGFDLYTLNELLTPTNTVINTNSIDSDVIKEFNTCLRTLFDSNYLNNYGYKLYIKYLLDYRNDKFNPLKNIRKFKYHQIKQQISSSIMLNLALDHAEKPFSISKIREIDDYFCYGESIHVSV